MSVEGTLGDVAQSVHEILESAAALKGERFANAVAGQFELLQASEVVGRMRGTADKAGVDVSELGSACVLLIGAAASRLFAGLSESDHQEALQLASSLWARRERAAEAIRAHVLSSNNG